MNILIHFLCMWVRFFLEHMLSSSLVPGQFSVLKIMEDPKELLVM